MVGLNHSCEPSRSVPDALARGPVHNSHVKRRKASAERFPARRHSEDERSRSENMNIDWVVKLVNWEQNFF